MRRIFKSIMSLVLTCSLVFASSSIAFALEFETDNLQFDFQDVLILEIDGVRTATISDETTEYTTVFNTVDNTIQVFAKNLLTNVVSAGVLVSTDIDTKITLQTVIHQDTFSNFEYDIYTGNPNEWNLERPSGAFSQYYFMVYENSSNEAELDKFYNGVNTLNDREWDAVAAYSLALVTTAASGFISGMAVASGGILTPAVIASIVAATGATGNAAVALARIGTSCNDCLRAYMEVYHATDNMHF